MFVDPSGLEDIYIFYGLPHGENGGFYDRAKAEADSWIGRGRTIKMVAITSEKQFVNEWNSMENANGRIEKVSLYFHSNPHTLIIDYTKSEYITIYEDGTTDAGSSATSISSLDKKTISTICLYSCNSAHLNYKDNLANTFFKTQDVNTVYGWDGSMKWDDKNGGTPILANRQGYFRSWLPKHINRKPAGLIKYSRETISSVTIPGTWDRR